MHLLDGTVEHPVKTNLQQLYMKLEKNVSAINMLFLNTTVSLIQHFQQIDFPRHILICHESIIRETNSEEKSNRISYFQLL